MNSSNCAVTLSVSFTMALDFPLDFRRRVGLPRQHLRRAANDIEGIPGFMRQPRRREVHLSFKMRIHLCSRAPAGFATQTHTRHRAPGQSGARRGNARKENNHELLPQVFGHDLMVYLSVDIDNTSPCNSRLVTSVRNFLIGQSAMLTADVRASARVLFAANTGGGGGRGPAPLRRARRNSGLAGALRRRRLGIECQFAPFAIQNAGNPAVPRWS